MKFLPNVPAPFHRCQAALLAALAASLLAAGGAAAQVQPANPAASLADMTLEQLSNISVTSIGKRAQRLADVAGSVYVIRGDDIRRSGATTLPEALRLAPNLQVARVDATRWAITARGGADVLANKMLVLVDGRTVYSPLFSGVFWEAQDLLLNDVDRIEVLSGSGGTLYGSNAFHGVINVITRSALDTTGVLAKVSASRDERTAAARWGRADADSGLRLWGKRRLVDASPLEAGGALPGDAHRSQLGFRYDRGPADAQLTLSGEVSAQRVGAPLGVQDYEGGHLLARATSESQGRVTRMQAHLERFQVDLPQSVRSTVDTLDLELQQQSSPLEGHVLIWGAGWRAQRDDVLNRDPARLALVPARRDLRLWNVFAQDEFTIAPQLTASIGIKAEHNSYTGLEWLPSARLAWQPASGALWWGSVSRVVRTPARIDREAASPPLTLSPGFDSEVARIHELGFRGQPHGQLSFAATLFHHDYRRLRSFDLAGSTGTFNNNYRGRLRGLESWGELRATERWRLRAGYTLLRTHYRPEAGTSPTPPGPVLGNDPRYHASLASSWDLGARMSVDLFVRRYGARPDPVVPGYTAVDLRWAWQARPELELSLLLRNLNDPQHVEWGSPGSRSQVRRAALLQAVWRH